jgi:hypothetical protein
MNTATLYNCEATAAQSELEAFYWRNRELVAGAFGLSGYATLNEIGNIECGCGLEDVCYNVAAAHETFEVWRLNNITGHEERIAIIRSLSGLVNYLDSLKGTNFDQYLARQLCDPTVVAAIVHATFSITR